MTNENKPRASKPTWSSEGSSADGAMRRRAKETAYYLDGKLPYLALIAKGVRFPAGPWIWVASESSTPSLVDALVRDLFPLVKDARIPFTTLLTDFDADRFEQEMRNGKTGP
jgi:hypothetical protein